MMKKEKVKNKKKIIIIATSLLFACSIVFVVWLLFFQETTSEDVLEAIVKEDKDAVISIGIYDNGKEEKYLYTKDGKQDYVEYNYQIGSITKTMTGAMIAKQVDEGRMSIDDKIGNYLDLPKNCYNPTVKELITHRSGLSTEWEDIVLVDDKMTMIRFSREDMIKTLENCKVKPGKYDFEYSNFGSGLAGTTVANVIDSSRSYQDIMNEFIKEEFMLENTTIGGKGEFKNNCEWPKGDEMMADGAAVSNVSDLLEYGKLYLLDDPKYDYLDRATAVLDDVDKDMEIGYFWIVDKETGMIFHNGDDALTDILGYLLMEGK